MKQQTVVIAIVGAALVAGGGYGLYSLGMKQGMDMAAPAAAPAAGNAGSTDGSGRKVLYWHDPMVPGQKFDKPGKSPFMDMQLVPVYADQADAGGGVSISSRVQQNLGVRLAEATRGEVAPVIEAVGTVVYNERDLAVVQARANGFVEKLHVRAALDPVRRGQPLAELYVPDWVAAQEEYLGVVGMGGPGLDALREGAVQRMRLAGMTEDQVRRVTTTGKVHARLTLTSPIDGVVAELGAREGMTVMSGAPLFRINGLSPIWVNAEVPEGQAAYVRPGNAVEAHAAALPGRVFKGKVSAILPEVNAATRTLKARVELSNPGGQLVPGMFATVNFSGPARRQVVMVPTEAVIPTGRRTVVVLAETGEDGRQRFRPVDIETGSESGGMTEIRKGIEPGMKVVVSGQFLIDSEANLKATTDRFAEAPPAGKVHSAEGRIESIDAHSVMLSHGPIPELKWGPMTMEFKVRHGVPVEGIREGSDVVFDFLDAGGGEYEITALRPKPAPAPKAAK
jgi:membrane fusion protein, copper/silver efflux system